MEAAVEMALGSWKRSGIIPYEPINKSLTHGPSRTKKRGCVPDSTEQRLAEEASRVSRLHLSEAMDIAHIVYWERDRHRKLHLQRPLLRLLRDDSET